MRLYDTPKGAYFLNEVDARRLGLLDPAPSPAAPPPPDEGEVPEGRVGDVLDWAGTDPERLQKALAAELAAKNRTTLIVELERRRDAP